MDEIERIRERAEHWRALATRTTDARAIEALTRLRDCGEKEPKTRG
jgi:hypothetical protein